MTHLNARRMRMKRHIIGALPAIRQPVDTVTSLCNVTTRHFLLPLPWPRLEDDEDGHCQSLIPRVPQRPTGSGTIGVALMPQDVQELEVIGC